MTKIVIACWLAAVVGVVCLHAQVPMTGAGRGSPFTPASLSGLIAWYTATVGLYTDTGCSTPAADTNTVACWQDRSGNGYNLLQATSGDRPTYNAAGFNSRATVTFSVSGSTCMQTSLNTVAIGTGTTGSAFFVGQMLTGTQNNGRAVSYLANGASNDFSSSGSSAWIIRNGTGNGLLSFRSPSSYGTASISLSTNYRVGNIYDGSNNTYYINNAAGTPVAATPSWTNNGAIALSTSNSASCSAMWDGAISEVVITNTALGVSDRNGLDDYFRSMWGL